MKTVEIKMHYTFLNIFRFINAFVTRYLYVLATFLTCFALRYIVGGNVYSDNILVELIIFCIIGKFSCYIFSLCLAIIINCKLKNNHSHSFILDEEKIIHISHNKSKKYYYKDFKRAFFPKNYIYFKKTQFQRFFVDIKQLSNDEKENLKKCIKKARK